MNEDRKQEIIPFNKWSQSKIDKGLKFCTARTRIWNDPRVIGVIELPLCFIRDYLYKAEGAESPSEYQKAINQIFRRKVEDRRMLFVHFGDFSKKPIEKFDPNKELDKRTYRYKFAIAQKEISKLKSEDEKFKKALGKRVFVNPSDVKLIKQQERQRITSEIDDFEMNIIGWDNPNQDVKIEIRNLMHHWEKHLIPKLKLNGITDDEITQIVFSMGRASQLGVLEGLKDRICKVNSLKEKPEPEEAKAPFED